MRSNQLPRRRRPCPGECASGKINFSKHKEKRYAGKKTTRVKIASAISPRDGLSSKILIQFESEDLENGILLGPSSPLRISRQALIQSRATNSIKRHHHVLKQMIATIIAATKSTMEFYFQQRRIILVPNYTAHFPNNFYRYPYQRYNL